MLKIKIFDFKPDLGKSLFYFNPLQLIFSVMTQPSIVLYCHYKKQLKRYATDILYSLENITNLILKFKKRLLCRYKRGIAIFGTNPKILLLYLHGFIKILINTFFKGGLKKN